MDYIYAELNQEVSKNIYGGGTTNTATVNVDNTNNIITVDANLDTTNYYTKTQVNEKFEALDMETVTTPTGYIIGSISQTDGKVTATQRALQPEDYPDLPTSKVYALNASSERVYLPALLNAKQDVVNWEGTYDKTTNKGVTRSYLEEVIEPLQGALHFIGTTTTVITEGKTDPVVVIEGVSVTAKTGDVVNYPTAATKWMYGATSWTKYSDFSNYTIKGEIVDSDIKTGASINQNKIYGLRTSNLNQLCGNIGYLDEIDILISDESTAGSIARSIKTAIDALVVTDTAVAGQFVTAISETQGKIAVTRRALQDSDFAVDLISQTKINGLPTRLTGFDTSIANMHLKQNGSYVENNKLEFESGQVLASIEEINGILNVTVKTLAEADIPTISYTKISNWPQADWTETDATKQSFIKNKPTITYNASSHYLEFANI